MNRRFVPTRVHAAADYVTGPALLAAPTLLRLNGARGSAVSPRVAGASTVALSSLSDHELAARRLVPMRVHLLLDGLAGAALAATPWLTGSARRGARHWLPHALAGAGEVALALTTRTPVPSRLDRVRAFASSRRALAAAAPAALAGLAVAAAFSPAVREPFRRAAVLVLKGVEEAADTVEDAAEDALEALGED